MIRVTDLITRLYAYAIRLYPRSFRVEFEEEMRAVFAHSVAEAAQRGSLSLLAACLREARDLPLILLREHWLSFRNNEEGANMSKINEPFGRPDRPASIQQYRPSSWAAVLAGVGLFLVAGLNLILGEIPHDWVVPTWVDYVRGVLFALVLALPAIGYAVGWIKDFPRWSYPYVGLMILLGLYIENAATPGLHIFKYYIFGRERWGWRAWIPFLVATAVALLITRSTRPLLRLFTNVWEDWTRFTYAMYGFMPLLVMVSFDEMDRLYSLRCMVLLTLLMCGTALAYLRSAHPWQEVLALLGGSILTVAVTMVSTTVYWGANGWRDVRGPTLGGVIVIAVMFSPVLIGLAHHYVKSAHTTSP